MKLEGKSSYENAFVFVSDALRYEAAAGIFDSCKVLKAVGSGLRSAPGFSSLITGQYPAQHGVLSFDDQLNRENYPLTLFDLCENSSFYREGKELGSVLGTKTRVDHCSLGEIDAPFFLMERDLTPHAPYGYSEESDLSVEEYSSSSRGVAAKDYQESAEASRKKFESRIETLRDRGLLEDTLVIFTADHGEVVGEHGHYGHGTTTTPEQVYVPLTFYNDSISVSGNGFPAHIDILPTVARAVGYDSDRSTFPGIDLFSGAPDHRMIYNQDVTEWSVWDDSGGHVFYEQSLLYRVGWWGHQMFRSAYAPLNRQRPVETLRAAFNGVRDGHSVFGRPEFSADEARSFGEAVRQDRVERTKRDAEEIDRGHLEDLGYLEG